MDEGERQIYMKRRLWEPEAWARFVLIKKCEWAFTQALYIIVSYVNSITIAIFRNGFDNLREEKEDEEEDDSYNDNSDGYENNVNSDDGDNDNRDMIISDGAKKKRRRSGRERQWAGEASRNGGWLFYTMVELVVEMVVMVMLVMVVVQVDFCSDNGGDDSDRTWEFWWFRCDHYLYDGRKGDESVDVFD